MCKYGGSLERVPGSLCKWSKRAKRAKRAPPNSTTDYLAGRLLGMGLCIILITAGNLLGSGISENHLQPGDSVIIGH